MEETALIVTAIRRHSDKKSVDGPCDEALKDADVRRHTLYTLHEGADLPRPRQARMERAMVGLSFLRLAVCAVSLARIWRRRKRKMSRFSEIPGNFRKKVVKKRIQPLAILAEVGLYC